VLGGYERLYYLVEVQIHNSNIVRVFFVVQGAATNILTGRGELDVACIHLSCRSVAPRWLPHEPVGSGRTLMQDHHDYCHGVVVLGRESYLTFFFSRFLLDGFSFPLARSFFIGT
jgi:hypothetical protein